MGGCDVSGFELVDVREITVTGSGLASSSEATAGWSDVNQVVTFGGLRGGGSEVIAGASNDHCYGHGRVFPSGTSTVSVVRNGVGCGPAHNGIYTVYVVEWGSEWNVQRVTVTGNNGGQGANAVGEYDTAAITSVARDNTWVWAAGHTSDGGIGDSWAGQIATLGDGVTQNANETVVAVGAEYSDTRGAEVFVMEHVDAEVDYRFKVDGDNTVVTYDHTVDTGEDIYFQGGVTGGVSMVAMDGVNGGWSVLYGADPLDNSQIDLAVDEDDILDTERNHTSEEFDYWMFNAPFGVIRNSGGSVIGAYGIENNVGTTSVNVAYGRTLSNPIVVATYNLPDAADEPAVVRVDNVGNTSFDMYTQVASAAGNPTPSDVYWIAINDGAHTLPGSVSMEAGSVNISGLNHDTNWTSGQMSQITPTNSYTNPRVIGQIQTVNDSDWQVFWSSNGTQSAPPSSSAIYVGRHVAEDSDTTRSAEDVGYIIVEDSTGTTAGVDWDANRTSDTVFGVDDSPPYTYSLGFTAPSVFWTQGRFGLQYNSSNGTGNAFPRPYWGVRHTATTTLNVFRQYGGQNWVAWIQSIDLSDILY